MKKLFWLLATVALGNSGAIAQEKLLETRELKFIYYDIGGATIGEILNQLNDNSLIDTWANTSTILEMTADCKVGFKAKVIMPKLVHPETLSEEDRREVVRMIEAIKQHEMRHVYIGLYYAEEVKRDGCPEDRSYLLDYWQSKGDELDDRTGGGYKDGTHLFGKIK